MFSFTTLLREQVSRYYDLFSLYLKNYKRLTKDPQYASRHWATYICVAKTLKMNTLVGFSLSI